MLEVVQGVLRAAKQNTLMLQSECLFHVMRANAHNAAKPIRRAL